MLCFSASNLLPVAGFHASPAFLLIATSLLSLALYCSFPSAALCWISSIKPSRAPEGLLNQTVTRWVTLSFLLADAFCWMKCSCSLFIVFTSNKSWDIKYLWPLCVLLLRGSHEDLHLLHWMCQSRFQQPNTKHYLAFLISSAIQYLQYQIPHCVTELVAFVQATAVVMKFPWIRLCSTWPLYRRLFLSHGVKDVASEIICNISVSIFKRISAKVPRPRAH